MFRSLEELVRNRKTAQKVVWRSRIMLLSAGGMRPPAIAAAVGRSELTVRRWRRRYLEKGVSGLLKDATRPPGKQPLSAAAIKQVVELTLARTAGGADPLERAHDGGAGGDRCRLSAGDLALGRQLLLDELLPLVPPARHRELRLAATAMAIAEREALAGDAPMQEMLRRLTGLYGEGRLETLLRRFARALRAGAFEACEKRGRAACALLWRMTMLKLREGNPDFLAANGFGD